MIEKYQQTVVERVGHLSVLYPLNPEEFRRDPDGEEYEYTLEELEELTNG